MIYKNEIGQTITEENLKKMIDDVENERYDDFVDVSEVEYKRIEPRMVDRTTISVQIPTPMKKKLINIAKQHKCSVSELIRAYTYDGIEKNKDIVSK